MAQTRRSSTFAFPRKKRRRPRPRAAFGLSTMMTHARPPNKRTGQVDRLMTDGGERGVAYCPGCGLPSKDKAEGDDVFRCGEDCRVETFRAIRATGGGA